MERNSTSDGEYIDIVLGYHHLILFSLVFGILIFGTGYFLGFREAQTEAPQSAAATSPRSQQQLAGTVASSPELIPQIVAEPFVPTDVVRDMESISTASLAVSGTAQAEPDSITAPVEEPDPTVLPEPEPPAETAASPQVVAKAAAPSPAAPKAVAPAPSVAKSEPPAAAESRKTESPKTEPRETEPEPSASTNAETAANTPAAQPPAREKPRNAAGNIYLQVSTFGAQQEAEQLISELSTEGFQATIDGTLVEGSHTVLVGPFTDFKTAAGHAKELREHNREAFPIRR